MDRLLSGKIVKIGIYDKARVIGGTNYDLLCNAGFLSYRVSHETWQLVNSIKVFFKILLSYLIPKRINYKKYQLTIEKIYFKVKYIWVKDFFNELNCEKSLISKTVYERRHSKLFTNCHVSWNTLYHKIKY